MAALPWTCALSEHIQKYLGWVDNRMYAYFCYYASAFMKREQISATAANTAKADFLELCAEQSGTYWKQQPHSCNFTLGKKKVS